MILKNERVNKQGFFLLETYCRQLVGLFQQALTKTDPAGFLYDHNAREPLFMLESLLRLLNFTHRDAGIKEALKKIKKLEDLLGKIDDQDHLYLHFSKKSIIGAKQKTYFEAKRVEALLKLNKKLLKHNYYQDTFHNLISQFKINFDDEHLIRKMEEEIRWELKAALHFYMQYPTGFKKMESEVHELRRKLRWASMYGQSLHGIIQLREDKTHQAWEHDFCGQEAKKSPYNQLPVKTGLSTYIRINANAFCALNFTVKQIGQIKDQGLAIEALKESLVLTKAFTDKKAGKVAERKLKSPSTKKELLKQAHLLFHQFFKTYKIQEALFQKSGYRPGK